MPRRRWPFAVAALLALPLLALGWGWWRNASRDAAIRAAGDPVTIADLRPDPIPDDQNAAVALADGAAALEAFNRSYGAWQDRLDGAGRDEMETLASPTAAELGAIRRLIDDAADAVAIVDEAAVRADFAPRLPALAYEDPVALSDGVTDHFNLLKSAARLNGLRVTVALADPEPDAAARLAIATLLLAEHAERMPLAIGYLYASGVRSNALHQARLVIDRADGLTPGVAEKLDAMLADCGQSSSLRHALVTERPVSIAQVRVLPWPWSVAEVGPTHDLLRRQIALVDRSPANIAERLRRPARPKGGFRFSIGLIADMQSPALDSLHRCRLRQLAQDRCLRVLLEIGRLDPPPTEPIAISVLGLDEKTTTDPYTGDPLRVERREADDEHRAGWWVYSVGLDGVDDGGRLDSKSTDVGYAPLPPPPDRDADGQ